MSNNWQQATRCEGDEILLFWSENSWIINMSNPCVWFAISILHCKYSEDIHHPLLLTSHSTCRPVLRKDVMIWIISAASGEELTVLDEDDVAAMVASKGNTIRALKQTLATTLGKTRFQQRIFGDDADSHSHALEDDEILTPPVTCSSVSFHKFCVLGNLFSLVHFKWFQPLFQICVWVKVLQSPTSLRTPHNPPTRHTSSHRHNIKTHWYIEFQDWLYPAVLLTSPIWNAWFRVEKVLGRGLQYCKCMILMCRRKNPPQFCDHSSNFHIIVFTPIWKHWTKKTTRFECVCWSWISAHRSPLKARLFWLPVVEIVWMNSRHLAPKKTFIGNDFTFPGWASTLLSLFFLGGVVG